MTARSTHPVLNQSRHYQFVGIPYQPLGSTTTERRKTVSSLVPNQASVRIAKSRRRLYRPPETLPRSS